MNLVATVVTVLLVVAAALGVVHLVRAPSVLDRAVAADLLLAVAICALATITVRTGWSSLVPVMVAASLLGSIGSIAVARYLGRTTAEETPAAGEEGGRL